MSSLRRFTPQPAAPQSPSARWFVVRTNPHLEQRARHHLENQGFETFLPQVTRTIRHARRFRSERRPLFPQYLFVTFDSDRTHWRAINGTRGVAHLIMTGERPTPLPENFVETLIAMTDCQGEFQFDGHLRAGDLVEVKSGPFAKFIGQLERLDMDGRALLLLDMMGREVRIWSPVRDLSVAG